MILLSSALAFLFIGEYFLALFFCCLALLYFNLGPLWPEQFSPENIAILGFVSVVVRRFLLLASLAFKE